MNEWTIWKVIKTPGKHDRYEYFGGSSFRQGAMLLVQQMHSDGIEAIFAPPGFEPVKDWRW